MRKFGQIGLALLTCVFSLYVLPAQAGWGATSGDVRPAAGKTVAYESYVSTDPKDCKPISDYSAQFVGGLSTYVGSDWALGNDSKSMNLQCPSGYVMVDMKTHTSGMFVAAAGGKITNNGDASCCPVKHRWATPTVS